MGALSHDQFAANVNEGGASRLLHTGEEVPLERGRYAVSDPHNELKLAHPVVRELIEVHHERLMSDARLQHPEAMQGGWKSGQPPLVYLDSSALVTGRRQAVAQGQANKQKAVFSHSRELDKKEDTEVHMSRKELKATTTHKVVGNRSVGYTLEKRR